MADIIGTPAAALQILSTCCSILARYQQVKQNKRDIGALRNDLVALQNQLRVVFEPQDETNVPVTASLHSLQRHLDRLRQDIDYFLNPLRKKRHFFLQMFKGPTDTFYKQFILVLQMYQTECLSHLPYISMALNLNQASNTDITAGINELQNRFRLIRDSTICVIRSPTAAACHVSTQSSRESSTNQNIDDAITEINDQPSSSPPVQNFNAGQELRRFLGPEEIQRSQQRIERAMDGIKRDILLNRGLQFLAPQTASLCTIFTLLEFSHHIQGSASGLEEPEVFQIEQDVLASILWCCQREGIWKFSDCKKLSYPNYIESLRGINEDMLRLWKCEPDHFRKTGMRWTLNIEVQLQSRHSLNRQDVGKVFTLSNWPEQFSLYVFSQSLFIDLVTAWRCEIPTSDPSERTISSCDLLHPERCSRLDWLSRIAERSLAHHSPEVLDRFNCFCQLLYLSFFSTPNEASFAEQGIEFIQAWRTSRTLNQFFEKLSLASWPRMHFYKSALSAAGVDCKLRSGKRLTIVLQENSGKVSYKGSVNDISTGGNQPACGVWSFCGICNSYRSFYNSRCEACWGPM